MVEHPAGLPWLLPASIGVGVKAVLTEMPSTSSPLLPVSTGL